MLPILGLNEGRRRRNDAVDAVEEAANEQWKTDALEAVRQVCLKQRTFTSDEVWEQLGRKDPARENRAMGAVMRRAQREGYCEKTGRMTQTRQPELHASPKNIWRSLLPPGRDMPPSI